MNLFTNDILNIIYMLFNAAMSESLIICIVIASAITYILGNIFAYLHYRNRLAYPLLYAFPGIRVFAILFRKVKRRKAMFQKVCIYSFLFSVLFYFMGSACKDKLAEVTIISCIFLLVSKICGAYLNYDLLCYSDHIKKRNRRWYKAILLYFFPCYYLYYTLPSCYHIKGWSRKLAAMLAFIVTLNTFSFAPLEVEASNVSIQTLSHNKIETGCDVCDLSNEQIVYPFVISDYENGNTSYESYYGVTCSDCEIIHLIKSNETFSFEWHSDGNSVWNKQERMCGFIDTTKTNLKTENTYDASLLNYDIEFNCFVLQAENGKISTFATGIYANGVHSYMNDFELVVPTIPYVPTMNTYYLINDYNGSCKYDSNATKILPKNSNPNIFPRPIAISEYPEKSAYIWNV